MGRDSLGVVTGLAVLLMGVVTVANLAEPSDGGVVESVAPTVTVGATSEPSASSGQALPDVGPAVARVLQRSGNTELASRADLAQLPPSVATVLVEYGVPLRVPTSPGSRE